MLEYARMDGDTVLEFRTMDPPPPHKAYLWKEVQREGSGDVEQRIVEGNVLRIVRSPAPATAHDVNRERDRRLRQFSFIGKTYDFCDGRGSDINIAGAGTLALAAIIAGAQPGNLRWANANTDFAWIAADNTLTAMDAQTCLLFAQAAAAWKASHIHAARVIKDLATVPADYADNARWPS